MSNSPEQQQQDGRQQQAALTASVPWPAVTQLPTDGNVFLIFHGLFLFANRRGDSVEVGVHNDAPDHKFRIEAWEFDASGTVTPVKVGNIPTAPIILDVRSPRTSGTHFFQPPEIAGALDGRDWRLVPDLEGEDFYNEKLAKIPGTLRPVITINHGIFYTELPTKFEFVRISAGNVGDVVDLGRIAFYAAADISHAQGGQVTLKAGGQNIVEPVEATGGKRYVIYFSNSCPPDKTPCQFTPNSPIKEDRNDFHLYFRAARVPPRKHEFLMVKKSGRPSQPPQTPTPPIQRFFDLRLLERVAPRSTHEAPCGATGYGKTDGGFGGG